MRCRLGMSVLTAILAGSGAVLTTGASGAVGTAGAQPASAASSVLLSSGYSSSCVIELGKAYCWGMWPGVFDPDSFYTPVPVAVDTNGVLAHKTLTQISVGNYRTCVLDSAGAAYCWGNDAVGQLGDGTTTDSQVPVAVSTSGVLAGKTLTQISAGWANTACALDSTGAAYCWGDNSLGQLGDGTFDDSDIPVAVDTSGVLAGKTLTAISVGGRTTCALDSVGSAYCWGNDKYGGLGDGGTSDISTNVPVPVYATGTLAGVSLTQLSLGALVSCGLDTSGIAYCWGTDILLGTNPGPWPRPVDAGGVLSGKTLTGISAGGDHRCAVDTTGRAYCWGLNSAGQLGDGSTNDSVDPVEVDTSGVLAGRALTQISSGSQHTCAVDSGGVLYCWGDNVFADLGDNSTARSLVPSLVLQPPAGPPAPPSVSAVPGDGSATVSWTAPSFAGTLTGYTATASPGGQTCSTNGATTCTITGLANGTLCKVAVVAHSTTGDSQSSSSASVTPVAGSGSGGSGAGGLAFTSAASVSVTYGSAFTFAVTASGSPTVKVARTGPLPNGVTFTRNSDGSGTLAGTPAGSASGTYPMVFTASNKSGAVAQAFTLTVARAPAVKKIGSRTVPAGSAMSLAVSATGYPAPAFSETGTMPAGISLTDHGDGTAAVAGTPGAGSGGRYPLTVTAASSAGTSSQSFTLTVTEPPAITSADHTTATAGTAFSFPVTTTGFPAPTFTRSGVLPKGLSFSAGTITGTPRSGTAGSYPITITAKNSSGTVTQSFTLTVS